MDHHQITDRPALDRALAAEAFLLFKHSPVCPVSARAFRAYQAFVEAEPTVPHGWIDVIGQREWARWIAASSGVRHESPQALWIRAGRVVWHASHAAIRHDDLSAAVAT